MNLDNITTLTYLIKIIRQDGHRYYFTNYDQDINFRNNIYLSTDSCDTSAISSNIKSDNDHFNLDFIINDKIDETDILSGKLDNAKVIIYLVDANYPDQNYSIIKHGYFSEFKIHDKIFSVEILSLSNKLNTNKAETYSMNCRANFCDDKCKLDIQHYSFDGQVTMIQQNKICFQINVYKNNGYFNYGHIKFITGNNAGIIHNIKHYYNNTITLYLPAYHDIAIDDKFIISAGCNKQFTTCINAFNNAINFRGEPHLPGIDNLGRALS